MKNLGNFAAIASQNDCLDQKRKVLFQSCRIFERPRKVAVKKFSLSEHFCSCTGFSKQFFFGFGSHVPYVNLKNDFLTLKPTF